MKEELKACPLQESDGGTITFGRMYDCIRDCPNRRTQTEDKEEKCPDPSGERGVRCVSPVEDEEENPCDNAKLTEDKEEKKKPQFKRCPSCESYYADVGPHEEERGCYFCESPKYRGYEPKEK